MPEWALGLEVMVRVKICGITNLQDALTAIDLGAHALGFNFCKKSPRYIEPTQAKSLVEALPPFVSLVGVFVDEYSPERVMSIAQAIGISSVQLHGSESPEYVKKLSGLQVIKSFRVDGQFEVKQMAAYPVNTFLLDGYTPGHFGGTGKTFDWEVALSGKKQGRIILAGGLSAENIFEAVCRVEPYAVDICSGVESQPGKKDLKKMQNLFREIDRAHHEPDHALVEGDRI
jgi:phosphoribosylanthranilate isomerase